MRVPFVEHVGKLLPSNLWRAQERPVIGGFENARMTWLKNFRDAQGASQLRGGKLSCASGRFISNARALFRGDGLSLFVRSLRFGAFAGGFGGGTDFAGLRLSFDFAGGNGLGGRRGRLSLRRGRGLLRF